MKTLWKTFSDGNGDVSYMSVYGDVIKREYDTETPNGNKTKGQWVHRNGNGEFVDYSQYRNDLFERYDITILSMVG